MEKIQSALAKAREERKAQEAAGTSTPRTRPQPDRTAAAPTPQPEAAEPSADVLAHITGAWEALPALHLKDATLKRNRIMALDGGKEATDIDMMRTRVLQQMRDNGWRRLAITSPTAACGKSTIALNLALSLCRQSDLRTVLLELDLRRPSLAKMAGITQDMSFSTVLSGESEFQDNAVRYSHNLAISANQRMHKDAAELLGGKTMPQALARIEEIYAPDVMLFDTPPILVTDDMMAFARHMDCVLLVAGAESTTVKEIDMCEQDLASQTNVMGVVLNKCRYMGPEYGYGYYE